ncbi:Sensor_kinase_SpoOB-type, alpha-helical domain [Treponema bryantii]|uniref:Sensor_kinase_SpoOB-type, alpha-helical domain n=1 Tax=Treponema bryantii TaxID=163 RepID=A0A1I3KBQ7_9SPIR|nr:Sensor_kinase_SpoOB-type, alpha-helical domain [Treponema bryantii]
MALASICISVFITILILKRKYDKRLSDFQDSVLKKQRDEVQNIYQTMRAWRHDYHNHMQAIKALLSMGKKEELSDYLDNLEKDLDCIDIAIRTGNVGLDAILSSKVSIARKNLIDVNCTAKVPQELTVSDVHLCAIVGNLMDNAIEACEKMKKDAPNLPRFIRVYIGLFKSQLYISVINSTKERKRRRVSELVTSKLGEHGFGLRRIDKITEKYDGYVNRKNEPGVFATEVMLPL